MFNIIFGSTKVSKELCIQRYFNTAMCQFQRGDVILVLEHMFGRQMSYKSGVMTCRNIINGVPLGETLAAMTADDFHPDSTSPNFQAFMKGVSTSCKALGYTPEAAQFARRCCFALSDYFGLNSVFLTITPDDLCSFRVRLFAMPGQWVSIILVWSLCIYTQSESNCASCSLTQIELNCVSCNLKQVESVSSNLCFLLA